MGSKAGIALATTVVGGGLELMRRAKKAAERMRQKRQDSMKQLNMGEGVKYDQNMPYIPNQKIKTVKDKPLKKVPYGALAQSYVPQGETIDEKRKFSGMGELAKKYGLDPTNANDYMKLKNMMRKGLKRNIQDRLAPPEV